MANLTENTQYNSAGTQPSIANYSGLVKSLQQKAQNTSANTFKSAIASHFSPEQIKNRFTPSAPTTTLPENNAFPVGQTIAPQVEGAKFEPIPSYEKFVQPDDRGLWALPTDKAQVRNWPTDLGGGQYVLDPSQPDTLIKSERVLIPDENGQKDQTGIRKKLLGNLPSNLYQVDHVIPLWAGGADTLANLQVINNSTHEKKTAVQAVPLTLLANGKIDLKAARLMALTWKDKDASGLPSASDIDARGGYVSLDVAEKYAKKWQDDIGKVNTWKYFGEAFKENMGNFGKGWLPAPIREFAKGLVGGGTAGIVPGTGPSEDSGTLGTIGNIAGNVLGTITGLGLLSKGLAWGFRGGKAILGLKQAATLTEDAMKTVGLVTDIGNLTEKGIGAAKWTKWAKSAVKNSGLLATWGQLGLVGKEMTGQEKFELGEHLKDAAFSVAYGSLLGSNSQTLRSYAKIGLGSTAISLMETGDFNSSIQNGILMMGLHSFGYKKGLIDPKIQTGNEEAYKMSATTLNQYLGDIIPTVKKGQTIPETLKINIPRVDQMRVQYQTNYPNDQRFKELGTITNEVDALDFMEKAAKRELGNSISRANGTIPQEDIKKEMTRITVASNQLYNRTLSPLEREQKELSDLLSMGDKLRPQIKSNQLRSGVDATKLLDNTPFEFTEGNYENPEKTTFLTGNVPTTGYGENIDTNAKQNINDFYNNPNDHSNKLFIVKDPETSKLMRLIQQEQIANGKTPNVGNPDDALRVFVKGKTADGGEIKPVGYMPRQQSFDIKSNNLNKTYYEITNRLRYTIETSKNEQDLKDKLNKDKATISISDEDAKKLFGNKALIKNMSDEELYSILKPSNAFEKYDSRLNNSVISKEMDKHGINVLVVDKGKLMPTGDAYPRANPNNPYITLNLNEQDWLRSIALKDSGTETHSDLEQGIKDIVAKIKSQNTAKIAGNSNEIIKTPPTTAQQVLPISESTSRTSVLAPETAIEASLPTETIKPSSNMETTSVEPITSQTSQPRVKTSRIQDLVERSIITAKEAEPYLKKEEKIQQLSNEATIRMLKPSEQRQLGVMSKEIRTFLENKGAVKPIEQKWNSVPSNIKKKNINDLLESAITNAEHEMEFVKGEKVEKDPNVMFQAFKKASNRALSLINENKLGLNPVEQKALKESFNTSINGIIQDRVDQVFGEHVNLKGQEYSSKHHQYLGFDPDTGEEIPVKEPTEKKKFVSSDEQMAKNWNLKIDDKGYLVLGKDRKPIFSDEFKKRLNLNDKVSPENWYKNNSKTLGELYQKELDANLLSKTKNVKSFIKGIDSASKDDTFGPLFKTIRKIIDLTVADSKESLRSKSVGDNNPETLEKRLNSKEPIKNPSENWKLNSLFSEKSPYMQKLFSTLNSQGHGISQPKERIFAKGEEELKNIDEKTREIEEKNKESELNRNSLLNLEGTQGSTNESLPNGLGTEELSNMSKQDVNQMEKIHDLTKLESMFSSFQYKELTGKNPPIKMLIEDGIRWGKDFVSNYNLSIKPEGKTKKIFMDKDGWNKVKNYLMSQLKENKKMINKKVDGTGGLYPNLSKKFSKPDGKGGFLSDNWGKISESLGINKTKTFVAPGYDPNKKTINVPNLPSAVNPAHRETFLNSAKEAGVSPEEFGMITMREQGANTAPGQVKMIGQTDPSDRGIMQVNKINEPLIKAKFKIKYGRDYNPYDPEDSYRAASEVLQDNRRTFDQMIKNGTYTGTYTNKDLIDTYNTGVSGWVSAQKGNKEKMKRLQRYQKAGSTNGSVYGNN